MKENTRNLLREVIQDLIEEIKEEYEEKDQLVIMELIDSLSSKYDIDSIRLFNVREKSKGNDAVRLRMESIWDKKSGALVQKCDFMEIGK